MSLSCVDVVIVGAGPLFRFVAGSGYTIPVVARSLARTAARRVSRRAAEAGMRPTLGSSSAFVSADRISSLR